MYCPNCKAELNDINQNFCEFCGYDLNIEVKNSNELENHKTSKSFSRRHCC